MPRRLVASLSCATEAEDNADAATSVVLRAVPPPRSTVDRIASELSIEVPHGTGRQSQSVLLHVGEWRVDWSGSTGTRRFKVSGSQRLEVKLSTVTGRCEMLEGKCVLLPQAQTRTIEIVRMPVNPT